MGGSLGWEDFQHSQLSPAQLDERLAVVNRAHKAYQINPSSIERMQSLWRLEKITVSTTLEAVVGALSENGIVGTNSEERLKFMGDFLRDPKNKDGLTELLAIFKVAHEAISTSEALATATEYRHSLRNYSEDILKSNGQDESAVRQYRTMVSNSLMALVSDKVAKADARSLLKTSFLESISFRVMSKLPTDRFME